MQHDLFACACLGLSTARQQDQLVDVRISCDLDKHPEIIGRTFDDEVRLVGDVHGTGAIECPPPGRAIGPVESGRTGAARQSGRYSEAGEAAGHPPTGLAGGTDDENWTLGVRCGCHTSEYSPRG